MPIANAKQMLAAASRGRYAVGAFNCTNLIELVAVVDAAVERSAPLIIQTSVTPARFLGPQVWAAVYRTLAKDAPIPICLHLDHCTDVDFCRTCVDAGYTSIMIDASKQDLGENIRQTREIVNYARAAGEITVEGELGTVSGVEDEVRVAEDEGDLCNPESSAEFVRETGVDLFAPAIGTAHGVYRTKNPAVDFSRLRSIRQVLVESTNDVPLVVHGGTGLPPDTVKRLIDCGGSKFNVSTDLKHTLIDATYDYIRSHRDEYNPGRVDKAVTQAVKERISYWIDLVGCADKAQEGSE